MSITKQESWVERASPIRLEVPNYIREIVEQLAFLAREDKRVDKRSGVSQRLPISALENVISNAERRALKAGEELAVPRVLDIYAALPSITGKLELEYEGELKGGDTIARELISTAVGKVYTNYFEGVNVAQIVQWFELGGSLKMDESVDSAQHREATGEDPGPDGEDRCFGLGRERAGRGARFGGRVHPGRPLRASPHQPQRGSGIHGRRAQARTTRGKRRPAAASEAV